MKALNGKPSVLDQIFGEWSKAYTEFSCQQNWYYSLWWSTF